MATATVETARYGRGGKPTSENVKLAPNQRAQTAVLFRSDCWTFCYALMALDKVELLGPQRRDTAAYHRSRSGNGKTPQKLLASEYDKRHDGHHQAALEPCLLDSPNARYLEQLSG
jgi:hypothetical protein